MNFGKENTTNRMQNNYQQKDELTNMMIKMAVISSPKNDMKEPQTRVILSTTCQYLDSRVTTPNSEAEQKYYKWQKPIPPTPNFEKNVVVPFNRSSLMVDNDNELDRKKTYYATIVPSQISFDDTSNGAVKALLNRQQ